MRRGSKVKQVPGLYFFVNYFRRGRCKLRSFFYLLFLSMFVCFAWADAWDQKVAPQVYEQAESALSQAAPSAQASRSAEIKKGEAAGSANTLIFSQITEQLVAYQAKLARLDALVQSNREKILFNNKSDSEDLAQLHKRIEKMRWAILLINKQLKAVQKVVRERESMVDHYKHMAFTTHWVARFILYISYVPFLLLFLVSAFFGWIMHLRSRQCICKRS